MIHLFRLLLVGVAGIEPAASWSQTKRATAAPHPAQTPMEKTIPAQSWQKSGQKGRVLPFSAAFGKVWTDQQEVAVHAFYYIRFKFDREGKTLYMYYVGTDLARMRHDAQGLEPSVDPQGEIIDSKRALAACPPDKRGMLDHGVQRAKEGCATYWAFTADGS